MTLREARHLARRGIRSVSAVLYAGGEFYCPCCQRHLRTFVDSIGGPKSACPACGSLERQRLLILYLSAHTNVLASPMKMLHFAPEQCLHDRFRASSELDYVTADLEHLPLVDVQVDITDMHFEDESFDTIVCSHVLEHVRDDARAMREMRRILRPGGRAFLQHPIDLERAVTYEDPSIVDRHERARAFGQWDHVRVYGRDFIERLRGAGFAVEYVPYRDQVSAEQARRSALLDSDPKRADDIYICSRAAAESGRD